MTQFDSRFDRTPVEEFIPVEEVRAAERQRVAELEITRIRQTQEAGQAPITVPEDPEASRFSRLLNKYWFPAVIGCTAVVLIYGQGNAREIFQGDQARSDVGAARTDTTKGDKTAASEAPPTTDPATPTPEPSAEAVTTPSATATAATPAFTPAVLGCVPAATINVDAKVGVRWVGTYEKTGEMYSTRPNDFRSMVAGSIPADACLGTDTLAFDQALTDQNAGVPTYTYDAAALRFAINDAAIQYTDEVREKAVVLDWLNQANKDARADDAEHLLQTIRDKSNAISKINKYFMYNKLDNSSTVTPLVQAGQLAVQNAYNQMAAAQGIAAGSIAFVPRNAAAQDVLGLDAGTYPDLAGKCDNYTPNEPRFTCYMYEPESGEWQIQVNPVTIGTP